MMEKCINLCGLFNEGKINVNDKERYCPHVDVKINTFYFFQNLRNYLGGKQAELKSDDLLKLLLIGLMVRVKSDLMRESKS